MGALGRCECGSPCADSRLISPPWTGPSRSRSSRNTRARWRRWRYATTTAKPRSQRFSRRRGCFLVDRAPRSRLQDRVGKNNAAFHRDLPVCPGRGAHKYPVASSDRDEHRFGLLSPRSQGRHRCRRVTGIDAPSVPVAVPEHEVGRRVILEPVLVLGYPRIPQTVDPPGSVVTTAEVNAAVKLFAGVASLILSPTARGGFSGGLVLSSAGTALGVISQSLVADHEQTQLGFLSALRAPEIAACLAAGGNPEKPD